MVVVVRTQVNELLDEYYGISLQCKNLIKLSNRMHTNRVCVSDML